MQENRVEPVTTQPTASNSTENATLTGLQKLDGIKELYINQERPCCTSCKYNKHPQSRASIYETNRSIY